MLLEHAMSSIRQAQAMRLTGRVESVRGLTVLVRDLPVPTGSLVEIVTAGESPALGEVVGFDGHRAVVMMLGTTVGIRVGDAAVGLHASRTVGVGESLLGRCIDGLGRPIDSMGAIDVVIRRDIDPVPLNALRRGRIHQPMHTGVRAIDLMTTLGRGQRMGVFSGPGVGKSTLLGAIARGCAADVNVIALIGERGREVGDFIRNTLGEAGLSRSVVVVATSDESALMRVRAAMVAHAVAEHFRDQGRHVMLMMDSVTRFAHAQRQVGLTAGEPPATRGYTPSVFASLARLLERAGPVNEPDGHGGVRPAGSITALYSVLVEGDDMTEPIADAARGILDGHIILSRTLAQRGHFPAVDVLDSVSRVADDVSEGVHTAARRQIRGLMALYRDVEDLVQIGAYVRGVNAESDIAIDYHPRIRELLQQSPGEREPFDAAVARAVKLATTAGDAMFRARRP